MNTTSTIDDRISFRAPLLFAIVVLIGFGLLYSLAGAGLGALLFPKQAQGSLIVRDGKTLGSALIPQPFDDAKYFQPRPSAASYDPMAAAGSNMARSNPDLRTRIAETTATVATREKPARDSKEKVKMPDVRNAVAVALPDSSILHRALYLALSMRVVSSGFHGWGSSWHNCSVR